MVKRAQTSTGRTANKTPLIVGIGAAVGDALRSFLGALPKRCRLSFVVITDQTGCGNLADVLDTDCQLPVHTIKNHMSIQSGRIYVAPAQTAISLSNGKLRVNRTDKTDTPVDFFLESLAEEQGSSAVGVILSGTGSDGALGLRAIAEAGGMTMAQDEASADQSSMPQAAAGSADHIMLPQQLAKELLRYNGYLSRTGKAKQDKILAPQIEQALPTICDVLQQACQHDFRHYKPNTLIRRIQRRMQVLKLTNTHDYLEHLSNNPYEVKKLFKELLIGVTTFFRDPDAFVALAREVIPKLFAGRADDDPIRIWVPGCASGEEAYTIAILLREHMKDVESAPDVQIFATDLDERALAVARRGIYPLGIAEDLPAELLHRYFKKKGQHYQVAKSLRELCLFSRHNLISDPPLSRLDLVSCRNVLIYLGPHLQKKLIPMFHQSLRPGGYLFLGPAENLVAHQTLFQPISAKHRISRSKSVGDAPVSERATERTNLPPMVHAVPDSDDLQQLAQRIVLDEFAPKYAIVNDEQQIQYVSEGASKYFEMGAGVFSNNIVRLARTGLRVGLRSALQEARKKRRRIERFNLSVAVQEGLQPLTLTVQPMPQLGEDSGLFIVVLQDAGPVLSGSDAKPKNIPESADSVVETLIEQLEHELASSRSDLEKTVQELEAANEELKSSNEELRTLNEEYQSANEELEASKDELQRSAEALGKAKSDLENLLQCTDIATIFLDDQFAIRFFTPAAANIYNLITSDIGRPLAHLTHRLKNMPGLPSIEQLAAAENPLEDELESVDGRFYLRRLSVYRGQDDSAQGLVLTFTDITDLHESNRQAHEWLAEIEAVYAQAPIGLCVIDKEFRWRRINEHLAEINGFSPEHHIGKQLRELIPDMAESAEAILQQIFASGEPRRDIELNGETAAQPGVVRSWRSNWFPLFDSSGQVIAVNVAAEEITEQKRQEEMLRLRDRAMASATDALLIADARQEDLPVIYVNDAFERITGYAQAEAIGRNCRFLQGPDTDPNTVAEIRTALQEQHECDVTLLNYRKDGRPFWNALRISPVRDDSGQVSHFLGVLTDVTERKNFEHKLQESEQFIRNVLDSLFVFAGVCTPDGILVEANRAALDAAGLHAEDVLGKPFEQAYWWSFSAESQQQLQNAIQKASGGEASRYDATVRLSEDQFIVIDFQLVPMRDSQGHITHLIPSGIDISERKRAEQAIQASDERFRLLLDSTAEAIYGVDTEGNCTFCNAACVKMLGYRSSDELLGQNMHRLIHHSREDQTPYHVQDCPIYKVMAGGDGIEVNNEVFWRADNTPLPVMYWSYPMHHDGRPVGAVVTFLDISERREAERRLQRQASLLELSHDAILIWGEASGITFWNKGAEALYGYSKDEALSQNPHSLLKTVHPQPLAEIEAELQSRGQWEGELRQENKNGRRVIVSSRHQLVQEAGKSSQVFEINRDISDRKQFEQSMREAQQAAENANRSKSQFLANMSHEIRTPMTAILGYADVLVSQLSNPDDLECVDTIKRNGRYLLDIVNDILDLSKIEAGKFEVQEQDCSPVELVADVRSLMEVRAQEKRLPLRVEFENAIPETIRTDPVRLRQILINLLSNAIKFTDQGHVKLSVRYLDEQQSPQLRFQVSDTGIGISAEQQQLLFQPFTQVDASHTRRYGGTGLGLAISRRLAEMLGGQICLQSSLGQGSVLTLTVPSGLSDAVTLIEPSGDIMSESGEGTTKQQSLNLRVLVVDDRRDIRYLAQHFLEEAGAQVAVAENGQAAIDAIAKAKHQKREFDVVVMDMQMPVLDGYQATKRLRASGFKQPIIALTAGAMQGEREKCLQAGCDEFITKPIEGYRLVEIVARCCEAEERPEVRQQAAPTSTETRPATRQHRILLVDDSKDASAAMSKLLGMLHHQVQIVHSGQAALNTAQAFRPQVVILDINLPDMDGYEVASRLKQTGDFEQTVFIALSGSDADPKRLKKSGFNHYLLKPASINELLPLLSAGNQTS